MIFYVDSDELFKTIKLKNTALNEIILNSQIILISRDINTRGCKNNVINYTRYLYPDQAVYMSKTEDDLIDNYWKQLDRRANIMAALVLESLKNESNIIILASKRELKLFNYIEYIAAYIQERFHYTSFNMIGCRDPVNSQKNIKYAIKTAKSVMIEFENVGLKNAILSPDSADDLHDVIKEIKGFKRKRVEDILKLFGEDPDKYNCKKDMIEMLKYIGDLDDIPFL